MHTHTHTHSHTRADLYGGERGDLVAAARVDMMLDGVADLRVKLRVGTGYWLALCT